MIFSARKSQGGRFDLALRARIISSASISGRPCASPSSGRCAGTAAIISRLAGAIERGVGDGSLGIDGEPRQVAESLYQLWLGASIMVKIVRGSQPFDNAQRATRQILHPSR